MRSRVRSTLPGREEWTSGNEARFRSPRAGFSGGWKTTVTTAPSGREVPFVKTTTPFCTQPGISMHQLSRVAVDNSSVLKVSRP